MDEDDYLAPTFDLDRMKRVLAGPSVKLPDDLKTPQEIRAFMLGAAAAFDAMVEHHPESSIHAGLRPIQDELTTTPSPRFSSGVGITE